MAVRAFVGSLTYRVCVVEFGLTDRADLVWQAHEARANQRFGAAYEAFKQANEIGTLSADDIVAWGDAAWWLGYSDRALELAELGHQRLLEEGQPIRAAKEAIGLGFLLMLRGDTGCGIWLDPTRTICPRTIS